MTTLLGEVTLNDVPTKQKIFRYVEKQIAHWVEAHSPPEVDGELSGAPIHFQVSFTEDGDNQISCETEIQLGRHVYRAAELATDTQQAFLHSLKHLHTH